MYLFGVSSSLINIIKEKEKKVNSEFETKNISEFVVEYQKILIRHAKKKHKGQVK